MKGIFTVLLMILFCLLAGCNDRTTIDKEITQDLEQPDSNPNDLGELEEVEKPQEQAPAQQEPITEEPSNAINLVDPITKETIATIFPDELGYYSDYSSYKKQIEKLAKDLAQGSESSEGYDQRMILDRVNENGELIQGKPMKILKESELIESILAASPNGGDVNLPLYITESGYDRAEFDMLDDVVIAAFTTYFDSSVVGRSHNIHQSSDAISNVIVGVGDNFSFNTTVGPRTRETGYQEALEIVNGEYVMGIGGGICQTSSTLFNAVDQLGVTYVEWHHHSKDIGYVPKGRDATVSYGTLDFRFQNTTGFPFMIISTIDEGGSITVEIRTSAEYAKKSY